MSNSSIRKSIYPWFETVANFYLSDINQDDDENEAAMTAFLEHAMSLLQTYMKRKPDVAKKQWQNLPLAAALASFKLLHLDIDTSELWKQCKDKCDESVVKSIEQEMLLSEHKSVDEAEKKSTVEKTALEPEKRAIVVPVVEEDKTVISEPQSNKDTKKESTPDDSMKKKDKQEEQKQKDAEKKDKEEEDEDEDNEDDDEDSEPDTLSEVEDDDIELSKYRQSLQAEAISNAYIRFVHEDGMTRVWPFATGVDVSFNTLECVSRIFRLYVLKLQPSKTKQDVQNASAGALLAVLDQMGALPKKTTEASLVTDLYDALPMTSKSGILAVWQFLKAQPDLLKTKCRTGRAGKPAAI